MKTKIHKILGVSLAFILAVSLSVGIVAPAAAADYPENEWGTWGLPSTDTDTDIGPMAIAPDGTIYKSVWDLDEDELRIDKSEDNGYTWDATALDFLDWDDPEHQVVQIIVSPNYEEDETVYVATLGGVIYRLEEAGDDEVALVGVPGTPADELWSIDVWSDGDDNWILAGTHGDVYVLEDAVFGSWDSMGLGTPAYEVAFAPDFDDSEVMWVITEDGFGDFVVSSTISPGQWGWEIGDAFLEDPDGDPLPASPYVDLDFPDNYDSDPDSGDTMVFAGVSSEYWDENLGQVYLIEGVDAADGDSNAIGLFDLAGEDLDNIVSIAVSGDYPDCFILAAALNHPTVYWSDDGGESWDGADKNPTGWYPFDPFFVGVPAGPDGDYVVSWTHVYMDAEVTWNGAVFDPEENMTFVSTFGFESAVSRSDPNPDGELVYNQVGEIDTDIEVIVDLAFHPDFPDTPSFLMVTGDYDNETASLWITENGDEDEPDYMRVLCGADWGYGAPYDPAPANFEGWFWLTDWTWDAEDIFLHGWDDDGDLSIWKSSDEGLTFGTQRKVGGGDVFINDWEIPDDRTIYAATYDTDDADNGFYKTVNGGLSWKAVDTDDAMGDIALQPGFDADDEDMSWIALGGFDGDIWLSDDAGDGFGDAESEDAADLTGEVFVAFDADFADEDADGYMLIYAASQGEPVQVGEVSDTDDVDWDALEDDENEDSQSVFATGIEVAEDNALYVMSAADGAVAEDIDAEGDVELEGDSSAATTTETLGAGDDDLTDITGTFIDGEVLTVISEILVYSDTSDDITGTIQVEGVTSGATGELNVDFAVPDLWGTDGESVSITGSDLNVDITAGAAGMDVGVYRLLLHESNSEWESATDDDLADPAPDFPFTSPNLWLTPGSNVLWVIDWDDAELWNLEDTLSGSPDLSSPPDGYQSDREDQMRISWEEMRGIDDEYEYEYTNVDPDATDSGTTDDTSILLTGLSGSSEYEWKVRAAPGNPWHSRWSEAWTFFTALGEPPWAPTLYAPDNGADDVLLTPAFSWESANTADNYHFMLASDAGFTSVLVNEKVSQVAYTPDVSLEYNTTYYWKVQAYKGSEAISRWSDVSVFTTMSEPASPTPPVTVTQPPPPATVIPTPVPQWALIAIIAIGAALIIAVIVLIVRTRRAV
jgi:hypothetical protein